MRSFALLVLLAPLCGCGGSPHSSVTVAVEGPRDDATVLHAAFRLDMNALDEETLDLDTQKFLVDYPSGDSGTFSVLVDADDAAGCTHWQAYGMTDLNADGNVSLSLVFARVDPPQCPQ
jgi:hypothetical protein